MAESTKADQELCFRNVTLHNRERKEYGTLYLTKHHLLFRYQPESSHTARSSTSTIDRKLARDGKLSTESSGFTEASSTSASSIIDPQSSGHLPEGRASTSQDIDGAQEKPKALHQKPRSKEIWLPYPMINHCILRPSHLQSQAFKPADDPPHDQGEHEDGELFPPVFGTSSYERPSTDSARLAPYATPPRPVSPLQAAGSPAASDSGRQPAIRIRRKDFPMLALHFHASKPGTSADEAARQAFYVLRSRCCVERLEQLHAFHFRPSKPEALLSTTPYDARREYARMGIGGKAADGPGTAWRISDINRDYSYSATYPSVLCVPRSVSDNMLKYGGVFRSRSRIPCLAYLHSNGGSITRSSQPMVGVQSKRNPQDERLVSAIFSSHTPPLQSPEDSPPRAPSPTSPSTSIADNSTVDSTATENDLPSIPRSHSDPALNEKLDEKATPLRKKIYGSTRRNLIVDARPKINALANRATGGGIEDVANYTSSGGMPVERVFLNIANIHVMRSSLEKIVESFANSDYLNLKPDQEMLRKSGWLGHIANMMDGAEMVARVVGLGGSHVLIHCSDGWDRTAQISALAQIMLDPHYRTIDGFMTLIQKDFLSFGHKFRDRNGIEGSEKWFEIENERIAPSRTRDNNGSDPNSLNAIGAKALSGAKNWFEKGRGSIFRQPNASRDNLAEQSPSTSRPSSPPPNPLLHSPPSSTAKEEKEHKMNEKEISPIFHQFLDAIYQLQYHYPTAFEFREKLLQRLFYYTYACQYGEFLFNSEKERSRYSDKVPSVWPHLLSRRNDFVNPDYNAGDNDPLLFPKRRSSDREIEVRWWVGLFHRDDEDMNLPRALAPSDPPAMTATLGSSVSFDDQALDPQNSVGANTSSNGTLRGSKSAPDLEKVADSTADSFAALRMDGNQDMKTAAATEQFIPQNQNTETSAQPTYIERSPVLPTIESMEYDGDPLGVTASSKPAASDRLDFAAFASGTAFRDR